MGQYLGEGWDGSKLEISSVQTAIALVGLGPQDQTYRDACWPGDTPEHQQAMARAQSACALLAACILRCLGCRHELLKPPYYGRNDAMSRLQQIAVDDDAWEGRDTMPDAGDIAIIGTDAPRNDPNRSQIIKTWGTPGHALIVTNRIVDPSTGSIIIKSVDGGRGPVTEQSRQVKRYGQEIWLSGWTTRRIYGVIKVGRLKIPQGVQWHIPNV